MVSEQFRANSAIDLAKPSCFTQDAAASDLALSMIDILARRCSQRAFDPAPLPRYQLSRLLWAAVGFNRREHRTAPSAYNNQETDVYVALKEGLYCYDPELNLLLNVSAEDIRHLTGTQEFVADAPVNLVLVADTARMQLVEPEQRLQLAAIGAGCISQNVALQCAAEGLASVPRALIDRRNLAAAMGLRLTQRIMLAQSVGRPLPGLGDASSV
jgi:nitroreductase